MKINHKRLARSVIGTLLLLALVLPVTAPRDVKGSPDGYLVYGHTYHLDDYRVTYREFRRDASIRWYDPQGHQTSPCPVSVSCLVCHYEYVQGVFVYKDCYLYIRGENRELGRYTVQAGGSTDYFDIVPYYAYLPLVLR